MKKGFIFLLLFLLFPFTAFAEEIDGLYSNNIILYNMDTNEVLYEKSSDERVLIASLTKIMTSIVAIENIKDINEKVVLKDEIFDYLSYDLSTAGFNRNQEVTYEDLLYGALLPSGADATHSLAVYISGSEEEYIKLMNNKAKELGLSKTHFANTIGIEDENDTHYSSARDVATLLEYALKNKTFKEIFSSDKYITSDKSMTFTSSKKKVSDRNNLDLSIISGSKTGFTSRAGLCLASYASSGDTNLLLVTIGASNADFSYAHFLDTKKIYEYYFNNYEYKTLLKENEQIIKLNTKYNDEVKIFQDKTVKKYMKKNIKKSDLNYYYEGKNNLDKTIKKGDKLGVYYIKDGNEVLYKKTIYSPIDVRYRLNASQKTFLKIIILFTILTELYLIKRTKKKKKHKKR